MSYTTQQEIIDRIGQAEFEVLADRDQDGTVDPAAVDQAIADADAEIDSYLSARYEVPLDPVPNVIARLAVDLAVYRLADRAGTWSEERRKRYEDGIALLKSISKGEAGLGVPQSQQEAADKEADVKGDILVGAAPRRFGRDKTGGGPV